MLLNFARVEIPALRVDAGSGQVQALVHVGEEQGGTDARLVVEPGAAVSMSAGPDLEVEGAVDPVFLGAEDGSEVLRHR